MINLLAETFRSPELALDLGTGATRVACRGGGFRTQPSLGGGRPALAGGVVVDPEATVELLRPMLRGAGRFGRAKPRVVACTRTDATAEERGIVTECIARAGASVVTLVPEPVAAAIGSGIDVGSGRATMIVDLGEGVTDCAVIQKGEIIQSLAVRVGCSDLRRKLRQCAKKVAHLELSDAEAERLLRAIGVNEVTKGKEACIGFRRGRVLEEKIPRHALHAAMRPVIAEMLLTIKTLVQDLPGRVAVEVIEDGIFLSGGGALLRGLREQVAKATMVDVHVVADPLRAVIQGAHAMLPFVMGTMRTASRYAH